MILSVRTEVSVLEALGISGIAILIIIGVLALLMGFIYLLSFSVKKVDSTGFTVGGAISKLFKKKKSAESAAAPTEETTEAQKAAGSCGEIMLHDVDDRTAAMIMAIVADEMQTPLCNLRFKSIKEIIGE